MLKISDVLAACLIISGTEERVPYFPNPRLRVMACSIGIARSIVWLLELGFARPGQ